MKVVSLFSGAGGLDLGFKKQGFEIEWAIDYFPAACETYRNNIGNHIVCKDITQVRPEEIPTGDDYIYLIGSSCKGLSNTNRTTSFLENKDNLLTYDWVHKLKVNKPAIFVSENVPQILTKFDGVFAKEIIDQLSDIYHIEIKILNAADYGVPQKRKRCIMIGSRLGKIEHPKPTTIEHKTVEEAFRDLNPEMPNQKDVRKSNSTVIERFKRIKQGENWRVLPEFEGKNKHSILYKRLDPNEPSGSLPHAAKSLITHPTENRILSIRECARIQSFPDDFVFFGGLSDMYQQVGNAVPPLMGKEIARVIKAYIESRNRTEVMN